MAQRRRRHGRTPLPMWRYLTAVCCALCALTLGTAASGGFARHTVAVTSSAPVPVPLLATRAATAAIPIAPRAVATVAAVAAVAPRAVATAPAAPPVVVTPAAPPMPAIPAVPAAPTPVATAPITFPAPLPTMPVAVTAPLAPPLPEAVPPAAPARRNGFVVQSLAALSPTAARIAATRDGQITLAVALPGRGVIYSANPDVPVRLASAAKLLIMCTLLDQTMHAARDLTDDERALLDAMITVSDNDAADTLWEEIGGGAGVRAFLTRNGAAGITMDPEDDWGSTTASGEGMALLLARLYGGELLDPPRRAYALALMTQVVDGQRWGSVNVAPDGLSPQTTLAVKNGWYPDDDGWWVTSAGIVASGDPARTYTIAVLTNGQPSLEYGIETIETIAHEVHAALALPLTAPLTGRE